MAQESFEEHGRPLEEIEADLREFIPTFLASGDTQDVASTVVAPEANGSQEQPSDPAVTLDYSLGSGRHDSASQLFYNIKSNPWGLQHADPLEMVATDNSHNATPDPAPMPYFVYPLPGTYIQQHHDVVDPGTYEMAASGDSFHSTPENTSWPSYKGSQQNASVQQYQNVTEPGTWISPSMLGQLEMTVGQTPQEGALDSFSSLPVELPPHDMTSGTNSTQTNLDLQVSLRLPEEFTPSEYQQFMEPFDMSLGDNSVQDDLASQWLFKQESHLENHNARFLSMDNGAGKTPRGPTPEQLQPTATFTPQLPQDSSDASRISTQGNVRKPTKGSKGLRSNLLSNGGAKVGVTKDELRDLPQPDCILPNITLTAAEIHAYFPTILKSPEAMMRFVQNGITVAEQASLINWFHGGVFAEKRLSETLKARKAKFTKEKFGSTSRTMAKNKMAIPQEDNYGTAHYSQPFGTRNQPAKYASLLDRAKLVEIHPSGQDAGAYTGCVLEAIRTDNTTLTDGHVVDMMRFYGWLTVPEQGNWDRKSFDRLLALMAANPDA